MCNICIWLHIGVCETASPKKKILEESNLADEHSKLTLAFNILSNNIAIATYMHTYSSILYFMGIGSLNAAVRSCEENSVCSAKVNIIQEIESNYLISTTVWQHNTNAIHNFVGRKKFSANHDVPGNWVLEAKVFSYKLYTKSFLSLLIYNGWISDEVICAHFIVNIYLLLLSKISPVAIAGC